MAQYQSPSTALIKRKPSDYYNDHNYRDAIGRLKMMLNDSYSPTKYSSTSSIFKSVTDDETDTTENTIVERPIMKDVSKYYPYKPYSTFSTASSYAHRPSVTSQSLQVPSRAKKFKQKFRRNFTHLLYLFLVGGYSSSAMLPVGNAQPPSELLNFIEKQESYIEQLERESNFCRVSFEQESGIVVRTKENALKIMKL